MKDCKNYIVLFFGIVILNQKLASQIPMQFKIGIKICPGISWLSIKNMDSHYVAGLSRYAPLGNLSLFSQKIGVTVDIPLSEHFVISPDLLYAIKTARLGYTNGGQREESMFAISYIELPFNFIYRFTFENNSINFIAGPYGAIKLAGKYYERYANVNYSMTTSSGNLNFDTSKKGTFKPYDVGLTAGFGFQHKGFAVGVMYSYGLVNIYNPLKDERMHLGGLHLNIAFKFYRRQKDVDLNSVE